jgi:hypothetical protein
MGVSALGFGFSICLIYARLSAKEASYLKKPMAEGNHYHPTKKKRRASLSSQNIREGTI